MRSIALPWVGQMTEGRGGMLKRLKQLVLVALCCVSCAPAPRPEKEQRWVAYYSNKLPAEAFSDYDIIVFDRLYHPPLASLREGKNRTLLAYVSAGEVHGYRTEEIARLKAQKALIGDNKDWGSHVVDMTSATWRSIVMAEIQEALDQGFDGVMLDTIEMPMLAAAAKSAQFGEANRLATIQLIADIRQTYPDITLMMNRGFSLLPEVSGQLDFILAESILSETNVSTGQSKLFSPITYRQMAKVLQDARRQSSQLKIVTLDYWNKDDVEGIQRLYAIHRANGFLPYVTSLDLQTLTPEPHSRQQHSRTSLTPGKGIGREDNDA